MRAALIRAWRTWNTFAAGCVAAMGRADYGGRCPRCGRGGWL